MPHCLGAIVTYFGDLHATNKAALNIVIRAPMGLVNGSVLRKGLSGSWPCL